LLHARRQVGHREPWRHAGHRNRPRPESLAVRPRRPTRKSRRMADAGPEKESAERTPAAVLPELPQRQFTARANRQGGAGLTNVTRKAAIEANYAPRSFRDAYYGRPAADLLAF